MNKRILVTRTRESCPPICRMLESRGAKAVSLPCLAVEGLPHNIMSAAPLLETCSDVLFTSVIGVHAVARAIAAEGRSLPKALQNKRVAAVGGKTAKALAQAGIRIDMIPEKASQDGLLEIYMAHGLPRSLLFFRAEEGRETLAETLSQQSVEVSTVPAYRTVCPSGDASDIISMLQHNSIDAVLLGSTKTALFYLQRIGSLTLANRPVLAGISENMAIASRKAGLNVQVVAKEASFEAMLDALTEYFDQHPDEPGKIS